MTEFTDVDRDAWGHAITLEDLGELTARWLEGTIGYNPGYGGDPDPETGPVVEALAAINKRGFVTTFSQPGVPLDDEGNAQRASVEGYARGPQPGAWAPSPFGRTSCCTPSLRGTTRLATTSRSL